jgi:glycosyltransferase involved in cell wall biosynthesis
MKLIAERDIGVKFKNFEIIANSIDFDIFKYKKKCAEKRLNIVSIRSLANKKYATDKLLKIILELSKREYFEELRIELFFHSATTRYGKTMLDKFKQISNKYKNITITNTFLSPTEMNKIYLNNGIFLGTTRKDAQGVVMCEATSCGLVPIVSNNTAIPEFINKEFGFLCKKTTDFVQAIDFLYNNPSEYLRMSELSAKSMLKYNAEEMINKEIDFAQRLIKNSGK